MSKRLLCILGGIVLSLSAATAVLAQDTPTVTTVTPTKTTAVQNADGSWTVVEYPVGKEVIVNLTPTTIPTATGRATIHRMADGTMINLDLAGLKDVNNLNLYAVDPAGTVALLGPVTINNGVATFKATTALDKFMLVLSPDADVTTFTPETKVLFRSAVPEGFAVVPLASKDRDNGAAVGEKVAAVSTPGETTVYAAPMLNIPGMKKGEDSLIKVDFTGALTGSRANIKVEPRKDGPTMITARFHELKEAPAGQVFVLWAVAPDNTFVKLGQIVNTGGRNEAEIKSETTLRDFGLLVTLEGKDEVTAPHGTVMGTFIR
ncbi:MAG: hypothetical protein QOJ64_121 [Acidobacteriota bacterium]|jgi:hypothetical protein|nr:hypothetical protein [Acidobacteriota bacterium]